MLIKKSEVKKMNGKTKAVVMAALILGVVASAVYVAPTLAYMNGIIDQTRDRDMDRIRDMNQDCICDCVCEQDRNQTRTRLQLNGCVQNRSSIGSINWQYQCEQQYQSQYRNQNMLSP